MLKVKITPVGNSMGILLPKEALSKLNVAKGDTLYLVEGPDGGYTITPYEQDFEEQMDAADSLMKRYRNTLRQLAK
jgi:putative addiction module antidote